MSDFLNNVDWLQFTTVVIVGFIIIYSLVRTIANIITHYRCKNSYAYCHNFVIQHFGYNVNAEGVLGSGKTTFVFGLSHVYTEIILSKINALRLEFQTICYDLPFHELEKDILTCYEEEKEDYLLISEALHKKYFMYIDKEYDDGLKKVSLHENFKDYIEATIALLSNQFIMSNVRCYNHITKNYSLPYDPAYLEIKDNAEQFPMRRYSVMINDDYLLGKKLSTEHMQIAKEDAGAKEFLRLCRQIGKGTMFFLGNAQKISRGVKEERELSTSIPLIERCDVVGDFPFFQQCINYLIRFLNWLMSIRSKFMRKSKQEAYLGGYNRFKKLRYKLFRLNKKMFSSSFVAYKMRLYFNSEDVGKNNSSTSEYFIPQVFIIPIKYCFGSGDTHFFSFIYDVLRARSHYRFCDLEEMTSSLLSNEQQEVFEDIVKKRRAASSTNTINF